jgi:tripartite motif-containing protein 71
MTYFKININFLLIITLLFIQSCGQQENTTETKTETETPIVDNRPIKGAVISGVASPIGVSTNLDDDVFVLELSSCRIQRFDENYKFKSWYGFKKNKVLTTRWETNLSESTKECHPGFAYPHSMYFDKNNIQYIVLSGDKQILKLADDGQVIGRMGVLSNRNFSNSFGNTSLGSESTTDGHFLAPTTGILTEAEDLIYISDSKSQNIVKFKKDGTYLGWLGRRSDGTVSKWSKTGTAETSSLSFGFKRPHAVAVDKNGNLYIADTWNHRIQKFSSNGDFLGFIGNQKVQAPVHLVIDKVTQNLFVLEYQGKRIQVFDDSGKTIGFLGNETQLKNPYGLHISGKNLFATDTGRGNIILFDLSKLSF